MGRLGVVGSFDKLRMSGFDKLRMSGFDKLRMSGLLDGLGGPGR